SRQRLGSASTAARMRSLPQYDLPDGERDRHGEPRGQTVAVDERAIRRRAGAERLPFPVEQLWRRRPLNGHEHREGEPEHAHAPDGLTNAAEPEDRSRTPEEDDVRRAERERPGGRLGID